MVLLAGCAASAVDVPVPTAAGPDVDAVCRRLLDALPAALDDGVPRRDVAAPARTAAWGDPPVQLQCGAPAADPADPTLVVNGVGFSVQDGGTVSTWTTYGRTVRARITVPASYPNSLELLYPLAGPVQRTLPADPAAEPLVGASGSPAPPTATPTP